MSKDIQRALNIQLGLASDDDTPELGGDVEAVAETAAVAEGAVEVADATDEVVEADQTVDELSEAHENLEEVSEALEEAAANGGISQESARFAHLAIKAACGRFYSPAIASALPSVESFTGSSSRQRNTNIALESVGTMLRSFWDAIVRQIKKLWATVKNWYLKVLDAAPRLKKKAESLAKRSSDITGSAEEKDFDMGGMSQLHKKGKAIDGPGLKEALKTMSAGAADWLGTKTSGDYENQFETFDKILEDVVDLDDSVLKTSGGTGAALASLSAVYQVKNVNAAVAAARTKTDDLVNGLKKAIPMSAGNVQGTASKRFGADVTVDGSVELPGGRQVVLLKSTMAVGNPSYTMARYVRNCGLRIGDYADKTKDIDSSGTFKTLSTGDMRQICDEIVDICDSIMTYKRAWENRDKQFNKMDSAAKKAIARAEKDKDTINIKTRLVKDVASGVSAAYQLGIRFETQYINYCLSVSRAALTYVERSIAQYK